MSISVEEFGWRFVAECFRLYQNGGIFIFLFAVAVIYVFFQKDIKERNAFIWYILVLCFTVFNPLVVNYIVNYLQMDDEYYRFIWLLPVAILLAYTAARIVLRSRRKIAKCIFLVVFFILFAFPGKSILASNLQFAENLYKIPNDVIEISEIIHDTAETEEIQVVSEFELSVLLNQYDPSLSLVLSYGDVNYLRQLEPYQEWDTWPEYITNRLRILNVLIDGQEPDGDGLQNALGNLGVNYIVISKSNVQLDSFLECNFYTVGETENYIVLKNKL